MISVPLLLVAAAATQPVPDDCRDDRGSDRCATAAQAKMRALYGLPSIEEHQRAGDQVRRVMYVDGYGRDVVAISFVRAPGREPIASVYFPRREGEAAMEPLRAAVPNGVWEDILRRSGLFDRTLEPLAKAEPEICLHSWVFVVEANDPGRANYTPPALRRKTEDACSNGLARAYAEVERAALPLFPHCARLDPDQHRNEATQLAACRILRGDRMAAAEVMNRANELRFVRGVEDRQRIASLFAHSVTIDWQGERASAGMLDAAALWARKLGEAPANLFISDIQGLAADRARLTGFFSRAVNDGNETPTKYFTAPVELVWVFGSAQEWEVERATVGAWKRER